LVTHYDPSLPITVADDTSQFGVGAVISHTFPDGSAKAIAHASRTLSAAETKLWTSGERSASHRVRREKVPQVLVRQTFHTSHGPQALTDHIRVKERHSSILRQPNYRRIADFGQADGLSRLIGTHQTGDEDNVIAVVQVEEDVQRQLADSIRGIPVTASDIRDATKRDSVLQKVMKFINTSWSQKSNEFRRQNC
uniref:RT_RNaseH_2 domain-containing protein n=1 Tax=Echinostoma caproni TaxID=27848 RepID=A0A183B261_9TREM